MQAFIFYLLYPFIFLIASLPFKIVYIIADFFYFVIKLSGYRKDVVIKNLKNSFPEKSETEIKKICQDYYKYLCDLIFEILKTLKMSEKQARERCTFINEPWLDQLYEKNKSIIIIMGHYGNWEWAGPAFSLGTNYQLVVIYRPLSNIYFERMMTTMRTKFNTLICPANNTLREMVANRSKITATAFIADQTASPENAYWTNFLNQDTAVFTGPEKLAKKFNYPVVYMNVKRLKRGYYQVNPELLVEDPSTAADNEILEKFTKRLEAEINLNPATWLWSHKRWKHVRPNIEKKI